MAHWRQVALCMRQHGVSRFPDPTTSVPPNFPYQAEVSDRDGAIFVFPSTISMQSAAFTRAAAACAFMPDHTKLIAQDNRRRTQVRQGGARGAAGI